MNQNQINPKPTTDEQPSDQGLSVQRLVSGFDSFWAITLERWKKTPVKERNFMKRIGLEPNKETSYEAYIALKSTPPQQLNLFR